MQIRQVTGDFPGIDNFRALVEEGNFTEIVENLYRQGISSADIGETLFAYAKQSIAAEQLEEAKKILSFLADILEDTAERFVVVEILGDIHSHEGKHADARHYYGQLPVTLNNIERCLRTFLPYGDLGGLLGARDDIRAKLLDSEYEHMLYVLVDGLVRELCAEEEIAANHLGQLEKNLQFLQEIDPDLLTDRSFLDELEARRHKLSEVGTVFRIGGGLFKRKNNIWRKVVAGEYPAVDRAKLKNNANVILRCTEVEEFVDLLKAVTTDEAEFIKYECYVIVDYERLIDFLCVVDLKPLLKCDFVFKFVDSRNLDLSLRQKIVDLGAILPNEFVVVAEDDAKYCQQVLQPLLTGIADDIVKKIEKYEKKLAKIYTFDFGQRVAAKIKRKETLNILFRTTRYSTFIQHSTRDMAEGFKQLGHNVYVEMESATNAVGSRFDFLLKVIDEFHPDVIFTIDHLRYECPCIPKSIPFVTWVQDMITEIFSLKDSSMIGEQDYIYSVCKAGLIGVDSLKKKPAYVDCRIGLLPLMLNPSVYCPLGCAKKYDVTYVSHLYMPEDLSTAYGNLPDSELTEMQYVHRCFLKFSYTFSLNELTGFLLSEEGHNLFWNEFLHCSEMSGRSPAWLIDGRLVQTFMLSVLVAIIKCRLIKALVENDINVKVFGNGWADHPWFSHLAMGAVANGADLNRHYNETKINLNINPCISFHPKLTEVAGAKAFCLTRRIGEKDSLDVEDFFVKGKEVVVFDDEDELVSKVKYYLAHQYEREKIAARLHKKIVDEFTYKNGAEKIIQDILRN